MKNLPLDVRYEFEKFVLIFVYSPSHKIDNSDQNVYQNYNTDNIEGYVQISNHIRILKSYVS